VCDIEATTIRPPKADLGFCATLKKDTIVYVKLRQTVNIQYPFGIRDFMFALKIALTRKTAVSVSPSPSAHNLLTKT
jgi:hypothetical protein